MESTAPSLSLSLPREIVRLAPAKHTGWCRLMNIQRTSCPRDARGSWTGDVHPC